MTFRVEATDAGQGIRIAISAEGRNATYVLADTLQPDFLNFYAELARDFGTRPPRALLHHPTDHDPRWRPLLTENVHPHILSGYGDPAVLKTDDGWILVATSNDAPDAFPILHSSDLDQWRHVGFAFPRSETPGWTAAGSRVGDFWAPEIARVGDEYWLVYTARDRDHVLRVGLAKSALPTGPWTDIGRPLLGSGTIDGHIFVDDDGAPYLLWKEDRNGIWPRKLAALLRDRPELIERIFSEEEDRRTARFAAEIVGWAATRRPIERFFVMQPFIGTAVDNYESVRRVLSSSGEGDDLLAAMTTPILAQRLASDGTSLLGSPTVAISNDQLWEGHLVEGPFLWKQGKHYFLFYAANDFTDPAYGIGVAVGESPLGPFTKHQAPLLKTARSWAAPGHASVALGPDGQPHIFFHAFFPNTGGYNVFRALLTALLRFDGDRVEVVQ
ncbi:family 43 glycosylhydrolase [Sphingomonas sinipercae]|uniref:Family 43 glycosylhydrolase n=1 Tax=Sphingomonas sinipercae TaxID=2714944 RepID=A0A6G7ZLD8_9SPHN|nr:glycoside hydrolase family 43 protein [Sphingomonas sinipercae]QIL01753.1 family 43 glycosylhydrolase [Sphingomonas sinipercae]